LKVPSPLSVIFGSTGPFGPLTLTPMFSGVTTPPALTIGEASTTKSAGKNCSAF